MVTAVQLTSKHTIDGVRLTGATMELPARMFVVGTRVAIRSTTGRARRSFQPEQLPAGSAVVVQPEVGGPQRWKIEAEGPWAVSDENLSLVLRARDLRLGTDIELIAP